MTIRILLVDENHYESLLTESALRSLGIEVADVVHNFSKVAGVLAHESPEVLIITMDADAIKAVVVPETGP